MSRLIDRILQGCQPFRYTLFDTKGDWQSDWRKRMSKAAGKPLSDEEFAREWVAQSSIIQDIEPKAAEKFDYSQLDGVPVIAAEDVALYALSLPHGVAVSDAVASMAPPFDKFFIEFQGLPHDTISIKHDVGSPQAINWNAWGVLITGTKNPKYLETPNGHKQFPTWLLELNTFAELEKGRPFGPIGYHQIALAEDGTCLRTPDRGIWWDGGLVKYIGHMRPEDINRMNKTLTGLIFPALLTISFMHCKNVKIRAKSPAKKLSRKHRKKRGRDLARYHVLDIEPMRQIMERYRSGSPEDLRRALHICRGHFKTFTPDAPLFGRHTGTYWWASHVKGSKSEGVVSKDYRVHAPSELGKSYREADENPPDATREAPPSTDSDSVGRGLAAHNRTQNKIADIVRKLGWEPRSPGPGEPEFDVAWKADDNLFVCEVKSLTPVNEERQLRMGLGQVQRYKQKLAAAGHEPVTSVIAAEREPEDPSWEELCEQKNVLLVWPEIAEGKFSEEIKVIESAMN